MAANSNFPNADLTLLTLTAQAAGTVNGVATANPWARGALIGVNITALTGTLTVTIQGQDAASGNWYPLLVSAALSGAGFTVLSIYPGLVVGANVTVNAPLPPTFRAVAVVATGPCTATIGCGLVV